MKRILYIPFDHLHRNYGALKDADPKEDVIAFVESARMTTGYLLDAQLRHRRVQTPRPSEEAVQLLSS
jgi:deoxyribodipyrimidine photolyase-related protein